MNRTTSRIAGRGRELGFAAATVPAGDRRRTFDGRHPRRDVEAGRAPGRDVARIPPAGEPRALARGLKALEANHLVESRRGRGTYVRAVKPDEVAQMVAVRAMLEGLAARLVAVHATQTMIEQLERLHRRIEITARAGETSEWRDLDWSFHELVCTFSRNTFLLASWRSISNLVRIYLHQHPSYVTNIESILANHELFMSAIRSKDPDRAEAVFRTDDSQDRLCAHRYGRAAAAHCLHRSSGGGRVHAACKRRQEHEGRTQAAARQGQ